MKIAIIGAGFCGLGLSYFLLRSGLCHVTLFDPNGIGGGASGIAAGLLHPYAGEQGRRSWKASEGIEATLGLLKSIEVATGRIVASYGGVVCMAHSEERKATFIRHIERFGDVKRIDDHCFLIKSGITVHSQSYLQGLWEMIVQAGGILVQKPVASLSDLESYDHIVLAAGSGLLGFLEAKRLRFRCTKGQVLTAEVPPPLQKGLQSTISKGYLVQGESPGICYLGSTYERLFSSEAPDRSFAEQEILPKVAVFFPQVDQLRVVNCSSGARVTRSGHYHPIIARFSGSTWALTGMGSRGLLYHAYLGELLAQAIQTGRESCIPKEVWIDATENPSIDEKMYL